MRTRSRRAGLAGAAAAVAIVGGAAADNLTMGIGLPALSLDPHFSNVDPNIWAAKHFFDMLVDFDHRLQLIPGLAESFKPINDTTWEFKLRRGVKWHDGSPFTADDMVFTFERVPAVPNSPSPMTGMILGKKIAKIDDYTAHVSTARPSPTLPNELTRISVVSKKHGAGKTTEDFNAGKGLIGTGPYKFVDWKLGEILTLDANPDYWGGKPRWDKVVMQTIKSGPSRVAALLAGEVDVIDVVPPTDVPRLKESPNAVVSAVASGRTIYFNVDSNRDLSPSVKNNDGSPMFPNALRDWRVRKALTMAIDRKAIVERVMDGLAVAAAQPVPDGALGYNPALKPEPYDPEGAKRLLAQAGYPDGFHLTVHGPSDRYVNDRQILEAVAQMWTRIGVKTEVGAVPTAVYFPRATALEFSITMIGFQTETGEAGNAYQTILGTHNPQTGMGVYNRGRYSNVRLDAVITEALSALDVRKREQLLFEAGEIAMRDVALIPLHYQVNIWATRKGLDYQARSDGQTLAEATRKAQ